MFTGSYFNTIDAKGRAFIPSKMRDGIGGRVMLVKGIDDCLYLFSPIEWEKYIDTYIGNRSRSDSKARKLIRFFIGNSKECEIDKQGRINIPADHISYAGIEKDVVFIGCMEMIEIWGKEKYEIETDPENLNLDELMHDAEREPQRGSDGI